jgi:hypothetical protein
MAKNWFNCLSIDNEFEIDRTDYVFVQEANPWEDECLFAFASAVGAYFKTQRLTPEEIAEWDQLVAEGNRPDGSFRQALQDAFAEGIVGQDGRTVDEDAYLGTFAQLVFKWIRETFFGDQIVECIPRLLTDSSKGKGIDYLEILGSEDDLDSLYFIIWEIKGTDGDVSSRIDEIYRQHKKRSRRLLRGLQTQLSDRYEREGKQVLRQFASHLMAYWFTDRPQKRLGGCVVHDATRQPGTVFSTFCQQFPELADRSCRQVSLVQVPRFREVRARVLELLWVRI